MIVNFLTEFLFQSLVVFRKTMNTNSLAKRAAQDGDIPAALKEERP